MKRDPIEEAMHAHTNLNVFGAIVAMLEGGTIYGGNNRAARRIIAICNQEQLRQLRIMDAAIAKTKKGCP